MLRESSLTRAAALCLLVALALVPLSGCRLVAAPSARQVAGPPGPASQEARGDEPTEADAPASSSRPPPAERALLKTGTRYLFETDALFDAEKLVPVEEQGLESTELPALCGTPCEGPAHYQLDSHALRAATRPRFLSQMLAEDEEIAPGLHQLFAARLEGQRWTVQRAALLVVAGRAASAGTRRPALQRHCQLLLPSGTYNGERAEDLELLAVAWEAPETTESSSAPLRDGSISYRVESRTHALVAEGSAKMGTSVIWEAPPAGDWRVTARCSFPGATVSSGARTVTLNPELGSPPLAETAPGERPPDDASGRAKAAAAAESDAEAKAPIAAESDAEEAAR